MATVARKPMPAVDVAKNLRAILTELGSQYLERARILEAMMICILAREHGFLLGPPGTGKSALVNALCSRFTGANYFSVLLDRQLGKEELYGPIDIPLYEKNGVWERDPIGYLPWAHLALLDEVGKSGPAVTNQMLWSLNERLNRNGKRIEKIDLISAFGASNELLEMPEQAALWDRFLVRLVVEYIVEDANFEQLLLSTTIGDSGTTIDLADIQHAIDVYVPAVQLTSTAVESTMTLRKELKANAEIEVSDRRWRTSMKLLRASAFLNGRTEVEEDDLAILEHVYWEDITQIRAVNQEVTKLLSKLQRDAVSAEQEVQDILAGIANQKGLATNTRATFGADKKAALDEIQTRLDKLIAAAKKQKKSTSRLEAVTNLRKTASEELYVTCLSMSREAAHKKVFGDDDA